MGIFTIIRIFKDKNRSYTKKIVINTRLKFFVEILMIQTD